VFVGQSSAVISGSVLDSQALDRLADMAMAMAREAPADSFAGLADTAVTGQCSKALDLEAASLPDARQLEDWSRAAESVALAVPGVSKSSGAGASASRREIALVTSNGFSGSYARTSAGFSVSVIAGSGTAMERDYEYTSAIHPDDLKSPEEVGRTAGQRAARRVNSRKVKSQSVPVVYDRRVASGLVGHLVSAILGSAISRKSSFLRESLNEAVFPDSIDIVDDPHLVRGMGSRLFDGEGLPGERLHIVSKGHLKSWLLDLRSARQLGLSSTGHASRGISSPPSPSSSNVYMAKGNMDPEELIADIKSGLYVTELIGMGVNMVTGDYSRGASGFWIENGEIAYPVSEITVAGNLKDMFRSIIPANDLEFLGSVNAPTVRIEGLTIAGA
jgi:PmbA protein